MRTQTILALGLFLAVRATSQDAPKLPAPAQCKFSDGTKIAVSYTYGRKGYLFTTDGTLVTIRGVRLPPGEYTISSAKDQNGWALRMRKQVLRTGEWVLPPLPMSVVTKELPVGNLPIVFDQTGGSCMMYWRLNDSTSLLSLEFTRENTDTPVSE